MGRCIGALNRRKFFCNKEISRSGGVSPMPTECSAEKFGFGEVAAGICWRRSCGGRTSMPLPLRSRRLRGSSARSAGAGRARQNHANVVRTAVSDVFDHRHRRTNRAVRSTREKTGLEPHSGAPGRPSARPSQTSSPPHDATAMLKPPQT